MNRNGAAVGIAERFRLEELLSEEDTGIESLIDVGGITDPYPMMVRPSLPIEVAYQVFKRMEMRQIIIVDEEHHAEALLTRKSLLPWVVEEYLQEDVICRNITENIERPSSFFISPNFLGGSRADSKSLRECLTQSALGI